jgi:hypothetical protein
MSRKLFSVLKVTKIRDYSLGRKCTFRENTYKKCVFESLINFDFPVLFALTTRECQTFTKPEAIQIL